MISSHAAAYIEIGFDAIPLMPGSKIALRKNWPSFSSLEQWDGAPPNANIGLRCASGFAVIDADNTDSKKAIESFMRGLGFLSGDFPLVLTPNHGTHAYIRLDSPPIGHVLLLRTDLKGELRYGPRAYVASPPSVLNTGGQYIQAAGDLRQLPRVGFRDLQGLLRPQADSQNYEINEEVNLHLSRQAQRLLRGIGVEGYRSRSEAEQAILTSLANSDASFEQVLSFFLQFPAAGKFAEIHAQSPDKAFQWLAKSYNKAKEWSFQHISLGRQKGMNALAWAQSRPWPGRTGSSDRAVYKAHCQIAIRSGRLVYHASVRELAELAGVNKLTASRANGRLTKAGLLNLEKRATSRLPMLFSLKDHNAYIPSLPPVRVCTTKGFNVAKNEVFRRAGLGKSAGEIYEVLQSGNQTAQQLAKNTGRGLSTVRRSLNRMSNVTDITTGEMISLVKPTGNGYWKALAVDFSRIAKLINIDGALHRQKVKHNLEREIYMIRHRVANNGN